MFFYPRLLYIKLCVARLINLAKVALLTQTRNTLRPNSANTLKDLIRVDF